MIEDALLLKQRKGIRRQHFRPFIGVIARGITTGEDVTKAVLETIKFGYRINRKL